MASLLIVVDMVTPHVHYILDNQFVRPTITRRNGQVSPQSGSKVGSIPARTHPTILPDFIARPSPAPSKPLRREKTARREKVYDVTLEDLAVSRGRGRTEVTPAQVPQAPPVQPAPPHTFETGTRVNDDIVRANRDAWQSEVNRAYLEEVKHSPGLAFSEGILSIWGDRNGLEPWELPATEKYLFYAGRAVGNVAVGYLGGGFVARGLSAAVPRGLVLVLKGAQSGDKVFRVVSAGVKVASNPLAKATAKGALYALWLGGMAAHGVKVKEEGGGWDDVVLTVMTDTAGVAAFERGFRASNAVPSFRVRMRDFLEGRKIDVQLFKGGKPDTSASLLMKRTKDGYLYGLSVRGANGETAYWLRGVGARDIDLRLATGRRGGVVFRQFGRAGQKFWKASAGGGTEFFLYDPPRAELLNPRLEVPGVRTNLGLLRPSPFSTPPSPGEVDILGGAIMGAVGPSLPRQKPQPQTPSLRFKSKSSPITLTPTTDDIQANLQKNTQHVSEGTKTEVKTDVLIGPQDPIPKQGIDVRPDLRTDDVLDEDTGQEPGFDLDFLMRTMTTPAVEFKPDVGTKQEEEQRLDFSRGFEIREKAIMRTSARETPALAPPRLSFPKLSLRVPGRVKRKTKRKKKPKKASKRALLGEIDLLSATELDLEGVEKVEISVSKFSRLWASGFALLSEPVSLLAGRRKRKSRKRSRKGKGRRRK